MCPHTELLRTWLSRPEQLPSDQRSLLSRHYQENQCVFCRAEYKRLTIWGEDDDQFLADWKQKTRGFTEEQVRKLYRLAMRDGFLLAVPHPLTLKSLD